MFFLFVYYGYTQENVQKYREDQIYFSVYYNSLGDNLDNFKENKFSSSLNFGFIRDIPLSKSGKLALGIGLGLGVNSFNNNLKLSSDSSNSYNLLSSREIPQKNIFNFSEFQVPLEIRWRNSTPNNYKFWRIYAGIKYSRLLSSSYNFENQQENYKINNPSINLDQIGFTLNIGYNTWNLGLYKSLDSFFNNNVKSLLRELEQFKLGLIFYIL
tara:strand:- start:734 stop:1372 length:639 start_codon:yes stop_codon:yes gene_type:complete